MTTEQKEQLKKVITEQINLCQSQMDSLFERFKNSTIEAKKYYSEITKWESRFYEHKSKLEAL